MEEEQKFIYYTIIFCIVKSHKKPVSLMKLISVTLHIMYVDIYDQ